MNVVISLPKHLIEAIINGTKFFEIRSKRPLDFDKEKDVVFVVQKGTKRIPLYFTITHFYYYDSSSQKKYLAEKAAVSDEYFDNYVKNKENIVAWVIGCACKVCSPSCLYSALRIDRNPQSFIYRDYEWRQIEFYAWVWLNKPKIEGKFSGLIPLIESVRYMRSLSSAKPSTL